MRPQVKYVIVDGKAIIFTDQFQHSDMVGFNQTAENAVIAIAHYIENQAK